MTSDLQLLTSQVCDIARRAGAYIRRERQHFSEARVEHKHAHDYVSYVDKQSEHLIVEALRLLPVEAGFVTEEGSAQYADEQYCWVIDPLDGTTNFIHRHPPYAVSIALIQGRQIVLGVVYEICADECFYAWQGGGAYVDGRPLSVTRHGIGEALLCLQLPYDSEAYRPVACHLVSVFYGRAASVRMLGSAAIALCYVAAGRLDGYVEKYIGRWDYMAGALIVKEAGGEVSSFEGSPDFTTGNSVVASNGLIHAELLEAIATAGS